MDDGKIIDMLKKSKAFTERFSPDIQQKMLAKFPTLEPTKKLKIVQILVEETEKLEKIYAEQKQLLAKYEESLEELVKKGSKEMKTAIETTERDAALKDVDAQLSKL